MSKLEANKADTDWDNIEADFQDSIIEQYVSIQKAMPYVKSLVWKRSNCVPKTQKFDSASCAICNTSTHCKLKR